MPNTASATIAAVVVPPGRETIGRVAAGAIACKILQELGITVCAYTKAIGPVEAFMEQFDPDAI